MKKTWTDRLFEELTKPESVATAIRALAIMAISTVAKGALLKRLK